MNIEESMDNNTQSSDHTQGNNDPSSNIEQLDPYVHVHETDWKTIENKLDALHVILDQILDIVSASNEYLRQIIARDNKTNDKDDAEDEDSDNPARRTSLNLTKQIVDMIIDSPMLNISWIPDDIERTLYETIFTVVSDLLPL